MHQWKTVYLPTMFRITFSFIFLWAFFDKTFGFGTSTVAEKAWIRGGSPTFGFLSNVKGPLSSVFTNIAGNGFVDWLFMLGLLGIGIGLLFGVAKKITGWSGAIMMFLMWLAVLPIKTNPLIDDHIIYALLFLAHIHSENFPYSLNAWWNRQEIVHKHSCLE
jgi:thiosulfate dehydrogenase [quinone] large subunit